MGSRDEAAGDYKLAEQVGHLLRRANQRHKAIFNSEMPIKLPPTQFAALAMLRSKGELSQNLLGRLTAMDSATIYGVVSRLSDRGWVRTGPSESDHRMVTVELTAEGVQVVDELLPHANRISAMTLDAIPTAERETLLRLLGLLAEATD